ncbi:MAG: tRNA (adenosine(37)-N6)-threonylcarbamoyltransferase complex ATPase subunit type 1 TsaE [Arsenophonus endosymbiont of Ceratovacuna japonica]
MKEFKLLLFNEKDTINLGYRLSFCFKKCFIIYLYGDIGSGKTTFSRGFLQGLGYIGHIKSPTYTLVEKYFLVSNIIYHFDLYRLNNPEELEFIGIRDYFCHQAIYLIEWPKKGKGILPYADIKLYLSYYNNLRKAHFIATSIYGEILLKKLSYNNINYNYNFNL